MRARRIEERDFSKRGRERKKGKERLIVKMTVEEIGNRRSRDDVGRSVLKLDI